jgi:hypothetical protein
VFALDVTAAVGECANCGAVKRFAEAHVYAQGPGLVARCAAAKAFCSASRVSTAGSSSNFAG